MIAQAGEAGLFSALRVWRVPDRAYCGSRIQRTESGVVSSQAMLWVMPLEMLEQAMRAAAVSACSRVAPAAVPQLVRPL